MRPELTAFYQRVICPLEAKLLALPVGTLFTGILFDEYDAPVVSLDLREMGEAGIVLDAADIGRLFMAPDESVISVLTLREQPNGTPAGVNVLSTNDFVQDGEKVAVVAYTDVNGAAVRIDALNLSRVMLKEDAPERLCTVAFGLQACTALRLGFAEITLFAGGRGHGATKLNVDDLVGYQVWPKFGFDAPLLAVDLNQEPRLVNCRSVQDVVALDAAWWAANGRGVEMRFDLSPESRSWSVLLNYLYEVFPEDPP